MLVFVSIVLPGVLLGQSRIQTLVQPPTSATLSSISPSWTNAPSNGDTLLLMVCYNFGSSGLITSITEAGCTWTRAATGINGSAVELWIANGVQSASSSILISTSTSVEDLGCVGVEYSGVSGIDRIVRNNGTSTPDASGYTPTTTQPNEVWVNAFFSYTYNEETYSNPTAGYKIAAQTQAVYPMCIADKLASSVGIAGGYVSQQAPGEPYVGFALTLKCSVSTALNSAPARVQTLIAKPMPTVQPALTASWTTVPKDGDTLVMMVCYNLGDSSEIISISEPGCYWQRLTGSFNGAAVELWVACGVQNASSTFTVTLADPAEQLGSIGAEYSGVQTVDNFAVNFGVSNPLSSGSFSSNFPNEMWVSSYFTYYSDSLSYSGWTNGYHVAGQTYSTYPMVLCDKSVSTLGSAGNAVAEGQGGFPYIGFSLALAPGISLSSNVSSTSNTASLDWNGSSLWGNTVSIYSSVSPAMTNPTLVETTGATSGSLQVPCNPWTPLYYQAKATDGVSNYASNISLCFNNSGTSTWTGIESVGFWYENWNPSSGSNSTLSQLGSPSLVIGNGPSSQAFSDCAAAGIPFMPYMTLYSTQGWAPQIMASAGLTQQQINALIGGIAYEGQHGFIPTMYNRTYFDTDPNSVSFRNEIFSYLQQQQTVSSGFFIDNGYPDLSVINNVSLTNFHSPYVPNLPVGTSYEQLLLETVSKVKTTHPNNLVILNGLIGRTLNPQYYGYNITDIVDAFCCEDWMYYPGAPGTYWPGTYSIGMGYERSNMTTHAKWLVLSYCSTIDQDFYAYATAKLCNLSYGCNLGANGAPGHGGVWASISNLRLGAAADTQVGGHKVGNIYFRQYANGFVLVNPAGSPQTVTLPVALQQSRLDIYSNTPLSATQTTVTLPAASGRVYTWQSAGKQ